MTGGWRAPANRFHEALRASLVVTLMLHAGAARAQTSAAARGQADALFEHGKAALKTGDWLTACSDFQRSRELDESASTVVKIARCHEHDGHLLQAIAEYQRALVLIQARPAADAHARDLEALITSSRTAVESRLAHLRIQLEPRPTEGVILVDGQTASRFERSQTDISMPMDPGKHTVEARATGYTAPPLSVELTEGQRLDLSVPLTPLPRAEESVADGHAEPSPLAGAPANDLRSASTPRAVEKAPPYIVAPHQSRVRPANREVASSTHPGRTQRVVGYVTGSAGIVLGVLAGYFGLQTRSHVDDARADNHCDDNYRCDQRGLELIDAARGQQRNAIITGVTGGILVGAGIVLVATAGGKRPATTAPEQSVAVSISPIGAAVGGHW